ncbi:ATP-binding protein [Bacillus taeanensis]|uniref:histidine kinase n=1 Tax=Bacillus taeanensis TaxID=273032 RepID=A0A366XUK9_9BACI|nr:ATP-binding protein [Bacillus taeanensis]RBW68835.1 histidine kinase [Bacillus taeanensis]
MNFKWIFKSFSNKKWLIYIIMTVIPSLIISHLFAQQNIQQIENQYTNKAEQYANFHAKHIDNFIGGTIGRVEMLATLIQVQSHDLSGVEEILKRTHDKDIRFSGFYWANPDGDLLISSNEMFSPINVLDRNYFQQALKTGQTSISEAHLGRVTGRFIITIATPVVDKEQIQGVVLASLRFDKIEETINQFVTDELISVTDAAGQNLMQSKSPIVEGQSLTARTHAEKVPWIITASVIPEERNIYKKSFLQSLGITFIITNILFLLLQYFLLKYQVKLEKEQNENQKLELVGNLAASTAHEIKNPLTGIKGLITLLSEKHKDEKDQFYFEVIQGEITRINSIVSELLMLGKPTAYTLKSYNADDIIREIAPIIQSEANYKNVELNIYPSNTPLPILCVKDHLKQVILNLTKNSLESMENGGKLTIHLEKREDACIIRVKDNGSGMPQKVLDQVFHPFFTTKQDGTGLGLAVCKRIIQTYNGDISIKSKPNEGTEVEINIPLITEQN